MAPLTDCRWWFESLLVHSEVSSATRRKATGADHKKKMVNTDRRTRTRKRDHHGVHSDFFFIGKEKFLVVADLSLYVFGAL